MRQARRYLDGKSLCGLFFLSRRNVGVTLSAQTRRELIQRMVPRYREASVSQKGGLLDEIAATTGYARRYACGCSTIHKRNKALLSVGNNASMD